MLFSDNQNMDAAKFHYKLGTMRSTYDENWKYDVIDYYNHWNVYALPSLVSVWISDGVVITNVFVFTCEDDRQSFLYLNPNFKEFKIDKCYVNTDYKVQIN